MKNKAYNKFIEIFGEQSNGVLEIDSGKPGKVFTITACTHGNEPAGLELIYFLLKEYNIREKLISGKIQFIAVNIEAMKRDVRFIDTDMNRVFNFSEKNKDTYEYKRGKEISPYLLKSDYVFDLHSSSCPSKPFLIPCKTMEPDFIQTLDVDYCLNNFIYLLHGGPLIRYVESGGKQAQCCVLEAGSHYEKDTILNTIRTVLKGLNYYRFVYEEHRVIDGKKVDFFEILECITAKTLDSRILYSGGPRSFDSISKGELLLFDGEKKYFTQNSGYVILPTIHPTYIGEEICFIGK